MSDENNKEAGDKTVESDSEKETFTLVEVQRMLKAQMSEYKKEMLSLLAQNAAPAPKSKDESSEDVTSKAALKRQLDQLMKERDDEKAAKRALELETSVKDTASRLGVSPTFVEPLLALIVDRKKLAYVNPDGLVTFKGKYGDEVDVETGLKDFLKTDEGKAYLAPKGAKGSNDRRQSSTIGDNEKLSREDAGSALSKLSF